MGLDSARLRLTGALLCALLLGGSYLYAAEPLLYLNHVNYSRWHAGLYGLCTDSALMAKAQAQAERMASSGTIAHSTDLWAGVPPGTRLVVENVGAGGSLVELHVAFLGSVPHAATIYKSDLTHAGVGVAVRGSTRYLALVAISNFTHPCNL